MMKHIIFQLGYHLGIVRVRFGYNPEINDQFPCTQSRLRKETLKFSAYPLERIEKFYCATLNVRLASGYSMRSGTTLETNSSRRYRRSHLFFVQFTFWTIGYSMPSFSTIETHLIQRVVITTRYKRVLWNITLSLNQSDWRFSRRISRRFHFRTTRLIFLLFIPACLHSEITSWSLERSYFPTGLDLLEFSTSFVWLSTFGTDFAFLDFLCLGLEGLSEDNWTSCFSISEWRKYDISCATYIVEITRGRGGGGLVPPRPGI